MSMVNILQYIIYASPVYIFSLAWWRFYHDIIMIQHPSSRRWHFRWFVPYKCIIYIYNPATGTGWRFIVHRPCDILCDVWYMSYFLTSSGVPLNEHHYDTIFLFVPHLAPVLECWFLFLLTVFQPSSMFMYYSNYLTLSLIIVLELRIQNLQIKSLL